MTELLDGVIEVRTDAASRPVAIRHGSGVGTGGRGGEYLACGDRLVADPGGPRLRAVSPQ